MPDLIINGVSSAGGGEYGKVNIDGVGTIEGDIRTELFNTNGVTKIRGNLFAEDVDSDGILKIDGWMSVGKTIVDGHMKVAGSMKGEQFRLNGVMNIGGDFEVESLNLEGAFDISGLLNAGSIHMKLQGAGRVKEIGVEFIQVRQASRSVWSKLWQWMLPRFNPELHAGTIEGDDIDLEYTHADVVRGNRIVIGKGCSIGRVEYRTELNVHSHARIREEVKTGG